MTNPQLHPLELNPLTNEPFLRLRNHKNIIITPPRQSDTACYLAILNDPRVHTWLIGPPYPYLQEHAESWYAIIKPPTDAVLAELEAAKDETDLITVGKCPVRAIREVLDNGEEIYLGDIGFDRLGDEKILPPLDPDITSASLSIAKNIKREAGDPEIIWTVGDYLAPNYHGQGIMSDALKTILYDWAIPRMNAKRVIASAMQNNGASVRVFEKNGFRLIGLREKHSETKGKMTDHHVLEWNLDGINAI